MFLRFVALIVLMFGWGAFGLAQHRWSERLLAKANAKRPDGAKLTLWGKGPFAAMTLGEDLQTADPDEYRRGLFRFAGWGLLLMTASLGPVCSFGLTH